MLDREQILAKRPRRKIVRIEEWDGTVCIQAMSTRSRVDLLDILYENQSQIDAYEEDQALPADERQGLPKVANLDQTIVTIILSLIKEDGSRQFTMDDYPIFEELSYTATVELWMAVKDVNEFKPVDDSHADLKKNSD